MKNLVLCCFFLFFYSVSIPQSISKYQETNNQLFFEISFKPAPYKQVRERTGTIIKFINYSNEADPGSYALPSKEIIIALPSYSKVTAQIQSIQSNRIEGKPLVNPSSELNEDGNIQYKEETIKESYVKKELIEIKEYLWIKSYYCVHLKVNQYQFNNDIIEETIKCNLLLNIIAPGNNLRTAKFENSGDEGFLNSVISNYSYAVSLNKEIYEPGIVDYSWIDFSKTYLKIGTNLDGIYRITKADLDVFGINVPSINSSTFKIYLKGKELPITVKDDGNNQLDENGYIEFAGLRNMGGNHREVSTTGENYKEYLDRYSDTSIYWLTWGGNPGLRADSVTNYTGVPQDTILYYSEVQHYENNLYFDYSIDNLARRQLPQWKENQTWVEGKQGVGTVNRSFSATEVFPDRIAKAFYKIQDYASNISVNAHKMGLSINDDPTVYDSLLFNKYQQRVVKAEFNSNLLSPGSNILKTISYPTQATLNEIAVDWYEIEYPRILSAVNDSLVILFNDITSKSLKYIKIINFNSVNPVIYKLTGTIRRITNINRSGDIIVFGDSVSKGDKYLIIDETKIRTPFSFYQKNFINLADENNKADYILITHPDYLETAGEYLHFIKDTYNVETKLVNINDIYDQFNYGFFSPEPIRDFLKTANLKWQNPKPQYLFIVGDANYDYFGNKHKYFQTPKVANFVPSFGEPVSDTWFVVWDSTGILIPQMYIGRVPAANDIEFNHFFNKHKKYVNEPFDDWNKYYLFFSSGKGDSPGELESLKRINDSLISNMVMPPGVSGIAHHLYKTYEPRTNFGPYTPAQISNFIGLGGVFTCYIGHSGTQVWDNGISDVRQLHNIRNKYSLYSDFGCSTGRFAEPDIKAFGELFVNSLDGEAIGYTGNSSLGYLTNLPELFYNNLLKENIIEIGKAHTTAKVNLINYYGNSTVNKVLMYTNTLFSDPIIKLKIPQKPNLLIKPQDIYLENAFLDDSIDSVAVKGVFFNYGRQDTGHYSFMVTHLLNGIEKNKLILTKALPAFKDSILFYLTVKGSVGTHTLIFNLDNNSDIDEIYENDNEVTYQFNVASNAARIITCELVNNRSNGDIRIINPVSRPLSDSLFYEISLEEDFTNSQIFIKKLDTVFTKIHIPDLLQEKRYWFRSKLNTPLSEFGSIYSFIYDSTAGNTFFVGDSISYRSLTSDGLDISQTGIRLSKYQKVLRVISAGSNDGSFAVIEVNGNNYLPEGYLDGIHVAVFKDSTLEFLGSGRFSYWDHGNDFIPMLNTFLDTVSASRLVGFAFSGAAGIGLPDSIKAKIRNFGSAYIDSVNTFYSWALIGRKGSPPGSVPEKISSPFHGNVTIDSSFTRNLNSGTLLTSEFGPVKLWKSLRAEFTVFEGSDITFQPVVINPTGVQDTLELLNFQNNTADLSALNSYSKLKLLINFNRINTAVPVLNNFRIEYEPLNELGTNYQVINIVKDTVLIGENINISYKVFNCGFSPAENFKINLERSSNNIREIIREFDIPSLGADSSLNYNIIYNTSPGAGPAVFSISIDPGNKIKELFRDNNVYSFPVYVKPDTSTPTLNLTFDGIDISDGEYVSSTPLIRVELNDPSLLPITDTSSVTMKLNGEPLYYLNNPDIIFTFNNSNPKVILEYKPRLNDGEYALNVIGKNSSGAITDSSGIEKRFIVNQEPKLLNVYNYPNPFKGSTWFTFKLTQIPDAVRIRIYTIAGRLIKELSRSSNELKYDLNKIYWDGKDQDGDNISNGLYLYKVIMKIGDRTESVIEKIVVLK